MKESWRRYGERGISLLKYLIIIVTILGAFSTAFGPLQPMGGSLGFIYGYRPTLVAFGIIILLCALTLLYGKVRRSRRWTGIGLMSLYLVYFFGALLNFIALADPIYWVGNAVMALVLALLWLRWKFKTSYVDPKHFVRDVDGLDKKGPPSRQYQFRKRP